MVDTKMDASPGRPPCVCKSLGSLRAATDGRTEGVCEVLGSLRAPEERTTLSGVVLGTSRAPELEGCSFPCFPLLHPQSPVLNSSSDPRLKPVRFQDGGGVRGLKTDRTRVPPAQAPGQRR